MSRAYSVCIGAIAVVAVLVQPSTGQAQFRRVVNPRPVIRPVVNTRFFPVPVYHFNSGSYLQGAASVIDAQGRYLKNTQEAFLLREQVRAAQMDNRRRVFEQHQFERANTPTLEEQREFRRQQEFWRSWNDPPLTEIWSGRALNNLLSAVQRARGEHGYQGDFVPLDPDLVRHINVSSGRSGSIGVFRQGEDLRWPLALRRDTFEKERTEIDKLARKVVDQVASGKPDVQALDSLTQANTQLRQRLRENARVLSSTDYIQALRFVNQLIDSTRSLQRPGAASFFSDWTLTARDVGELVDQMTKKGLQFAPVTLGDEARYTTLHRALGNYASGLPMESLRELRAQFYSIDSP
ncbi:MAG: hypothetical protein K2R98_27390 [Gemmataceae bacterium]|nr:hypothetical protein [Gemmataceae bacterium]